MGTSHAEEINTEYVIAFSSLVFSLPPQFLTDSSTKKEQKLSDLNAVFSKLEERHHVGSLISKHLPLSTFRNLNNNNSQKRYLSNFLIASILK